MCFLHPPFLRHWFFVVWTINSDLQGVYNSWHLQNGTNYFTDPVCTPPRNCHAAWGMSWSLGDPQITLYKVSVQRTSLDFRHFCWESRNPTSQFPTIKCHQIVLQQHLPVLFNFFFVSPFSNWKNPFGSNPLRFDISTRPNAERLSLRPWRQGPGPGIPTHRGKPEYGDRYGWPW